MAHTTGEMNKIFANEEDNDYTFKFSFIDMPWDNRTKHSKIGIIVLLVSIFVATMACVFNCFKIQSDSFDKDDSQEHKELSCHMVKVDDYKFIARIYTIKNQKAICVGAVLSDNIVVTSEDCIHSGPIILRVGSWGEPRCRKNFAVNIIDNQQYTEIGTNKITMLRTLEKINDCSSAIPIGMNVGMNETAYVIGRVQHGGKLLSRQPVTLKDCALQNILPTMPASRLLDDNMICVMALARCPIFSGDLLVQNKNVFALSPTTTKLGHKQFIIPFTNISFVQNILNDIIE